MSQIMDILKGHMNEFAGKNNEIAESRMEICEKCPLFKKTSYGPICDSSKWINEDGDVSKTFKKGYTKGCGCRLEFRVRNIKNSCVAKKW